MYVTQMDSPLTIIMELLLLLLLLLQPLMMVKSFSSSFFPLTHRWIEAEGRTQIPF